MIAEQDVNSVEGIYIVECNATFNLFNLFDFYERCNLEK